VAIARAIITQPELLLYDSPTGGLDPVTSTTIVELIVKQHDEYHTSALMVTHRLQDAFTMASHYYDSGAKEMRPLLGAHGEPKVNLDTTFVILKDGKVIFDGNAPELARSSDEYIREYIA
jgi:phospholipid/cholesterol/gamma-HCH transport system ATP-binding protein